MNSKKKRKAHPKIARNLAKTLLQYIEGKRYKPLNAKDLAAHLLIHETHQKTYQTVLNELVEQKKIVLKGDKYAPITQDSLLIGTISVHPKGFGFVKNLEGPDVFIPKHAIRDAVDGDEVEVSISSIVSPKGPEGVVTAVLKRGRTFLAGTIISESGRHYTAYAPLLGSNKPLIVKAKGTKLNLGDRIICTVQSWGDENELIEGTLHRFLGNIEDPSIDIDAAIAEFELSSDFSKEALDEAKQFGKRISTSDIKHRLDLTAWECVTIDPDTARDFDDAISLTKDSQGHFHLGVHIADVAHYVEPGSHLDQEAFERCNSTYFPGRCVPMLPEALSNELCSLKPNVKRLTQSVLAEFDSDGNLIRYQVARTVIKSQKRFTYKQALAVIEKTNKSIHAPLLDRMVELCHLLKKKRFERGSIDFAMAEDVIITNEKGEPVKMERVEYDITHQMIEEFMLKANELVASHLNAEGKTLIYRVHECPSAESYKDFYAFARTLGFQLPAEPTHRDIQKLFQEAKDSPLLPQLSVSFIRSMKLALYSSDNIGHYGLSLEHYAHFTSPIRRYSDLIIQRLLWNELPEECDLEMVAQKCSEKERISFKAESSVVRLKKLRLAGSYFKEDPARTYPAVITRVKPFALFFEVPLFDLEGSLHVSEIGNDYYEFSQQTMSFRGSRSGKIFGPGQMIEVRLDRIDYVLQETKWSLLSSPSSSSARHRKHRKSK